MKKTTVNLVFADQAGIKNEIRPIEGCKKNIQSKLNEGAYRIKLNNAIIEKVCVNPKYFSEKIKK